MDGWRDADAPGLSQKNRQREKRGRILNLELPSSAHIKNGRKQKGAAIFHSTTPSHGGVSRAVRVSLPRPHAQGPNAGSGDSSDPARPWAGASRAPTVQTNP